MIQQPDNIILLKNIQDQLNNLITLSPQKAGVFFKTGPGDYADHDKFLGVRVPNLRKLAKIYMHLQFDMLQILLESKFNEERMLALIILTNQYEKGSVELKENIFQFYLKNLSHINNWNLVDASAHLLIGAHLHQKEKHLLLELSKSSILWERRIAIVSTWYFIRQQDVEWTFSIASQLLEDSHDLIHKAVGWMLREAGKRDETQLIKFLDKYASKMPRTMLRYAIERLHKYKNLKK